MMKIIAVDNTQVIAQVTVSEMANLLGSCSSTNSLRLHVGDQVRLGKLYDYVASIWALRLKIERVQDELRNIISRLDSVKQVSDIIDETDARTMGGVVDISEINKEHALYEKIAALRDLEKKSKLLVRVHTIPTDGSVPVRGRAIGDAQCVNEKWFLPLVWDHCPETPVWYAVDDLLIFKDTETVVVDGKEK